MPMPSSVTILVSTCDRYAGVWPTLCYSFKKYWPDQPWPLRFVTNHLDPPCGEAIKVGRDQGWTHATRQALQAMETPIVHWIHEDYWLFKKVNTAALLEFAQIVLRGDADYIRLTPNIGELRGSSAYEPDPRLHVVPHDAEYRAALQAALWRVTTLLGLLRDGESAWLFETEGSKRARGKNERFLSVKDTSYFPFPRGTDPEWDDEVVRRGVWTGEAARYLKLEGLNIDLGAHPRDR